MSSLLPQCLDKNTLGVLCAIALAIAFTEAGAAPFPTRVGEPARGVLLVASESLADPNFAHTVVLLTDHGILGSAGLVINRDLEIPVVVGIPELKGLEDDTVTLRLGGPLQINSIRLLVNSDVDLVSADHLFDDVYFVNSTALLRDLLMRGTPHQPQINYYAGYAAWSPGQLNNEIARGDWYMIQGDAAAVFERDPEALWRELIETLAGHWVLVENGARAGSHDCRLCE